MSVKPTLHPLIRILKWPLEEAYGLKQQSSKIKLVVDLDYFGNKVTYELPIQ